MTNITRAVGIPGYMNIPALEWLAEQAQTHRVIVELGSFCGRSTRVLADNTPGIVYAIDDWSGVRKTQWGDRPLQLVEEGLQSFPTFCDKLRDHIIVDKVIPLK